jgi:hypothetical protein
MSKSSGEDTRASGKDKRPGRNSGQGVAVRTGDVRCWRLLGLIASASAFRLAALRPVLFLDADEPKTTAVLANDPGTLDALGEPSQQLLEALRLSHFNTHKYSSPPSMRWLIRIE